MCRGVILSQPFCWKVMCRGITLGPILNTKVMSQGQTKLVVVLSHVLLEMIRIRSWRVLTSVTAKPMGCYSSTFFKFGYCPTITPITSSQHNKMMLISSNYFENSIFLFVFLCSLHQLPTHAIYFVFQVLDLNIFFIEFSKNTIVSYKKYSIFQI